MFYIKSLPALALGGFNSSMFFYFFIDYHIENIVNAKT